MWGWSMVQGIYHEIRETLFFSPNTSVHKLGFSPIRDISPSTLMCVTVCDTWPQTNSILGLFLITGVTYLGLCELFNYTEDA